MKGGCRSELSQTVYVVRVLTGGEGPCPAFLLLRGIYSRSTTTTELTYYDVVGRDGQLKPFETFTLTVLAATVAV
jgi:hypothetical protein